MMNVLIIEDEGPAARWLENLIREVDTSVTIVGKTDSVKRSIEWLQVNPHPDLIFMDIQLGDGLSFEIFESVNIQSPVIFTTAYDEYALKAFKVNSIDYILKPVDKSELAQGLAKLKNLSTHGSRSITSSISQVIELMSKRHKERFVVKVGEHLRTIEVQDIGFFYSQDKATFCTTFDGRNHIIDFTLDQLQEMLSPELFFRISRKYFVCAKSIIDIISYTNSRLKLVLKGSKDTDIIVARERVQEFKLWLDR